MATSKPRLSGRKPSRYDQLQEGSKFSLTNITTVGSIEERTRNGKLQLVAHFPGQPEKYIPDLSSFLQLTHLREPFCAAFLSYAAGVGIRSRATLANSIRNGFCRFLISTDRAETSLLDITNSLLSAFVVWLNQRYRGVATRASYLSALRILVSQLRADSNWGAMLPPQMGVPESPWTGIARQQKTTEVLSPEALKALYLACVLEAKRTMALIGNRDQIIASGSAKLSSTPGKSSDYRDFDAAVAAVHHLTPGPIPMMKEIKKVNVHLGRAIIKHHGLSNVTVFFQPTARHLVPFVLLLGIHFAFNPDTLLNCEHKDFQIMEVLGQKRLLARPFKARASRTQRRSLPVTDDPDNPATILKFLAGWTERLRHSINPTLSDRVFLFVPTASHKEPIGFDQFLTWRHALRSFLAEHRLETIALRQIRPTVLDLAHELSSGDLKAVQAIGCHQHPETILSSYTSDSARKRNYERLSEAMELRSRWASTHGIVDARDRRLDEDLGAATPGWHCLDPYDSPIMGQKHGALCDAYGSCPNCAHAALNFRSPLTCARVHDLLAQVDAAQATVAPTRWLAKWGPIRERLLQHWLPQFSPETIREARMMQRSKLPAVE